MQRSTNGDDQHLVAEELASYHSTLANFVTKICISLGILQQPLIALATLELRQLMQLSPFFNFQFFCVYRFHGNIDCLNEHVIVLYQASIHFQCNDC